VTLGVAAVAHDLREVTREVACFVRCLQDTDGELPEATGDVTAFR
jgi:hypothetical protein